MKKTTINDVEIKFFLAQQCAKIGWQCTMDDPDFDLLITTDCNVFALFFKRALYLGALKEIQYLAMQLTKENTKIILPIIWCHSRIEKDMQDFANTVRITIITLQDAKSIWTSICNFYDTVKKANVG